MAFSVSADGRVVVGYGSITFSHTRAVVWRDGQMIDLGTFPGGEGDDSMARDVSADGRVVVGRSHDAILSVSSFRWTQETGLVSLGELPPLPNGGHANHGASEISDDGRVIYGGGAFPPDGSSQVYRWTEGEGMVPLGFGGGPTDSNYDGSTVTFDSPVVGQPGVSVGPSLWDECYGLRPLREWLPVRYGLDLTDFLLASAAGISDDGRAIAGFAFTHGTQEAYVLYLPPLIEGDLDDSGAIDAGDAVIFAERMLGPDGEHPWCLRADLSGDGRLDLLDYALLQRRVVIPCDQAVWGDFNGDCAVSAADAAMLPACLTGPDVLTDCPEVDLDEDDDADLEDVVRWQRLIGA